LEAGNDRKCTGGFAHVVPRRSNKQTVRRWRHVGKLALKRGAFLASLRPRLDFKSMICCRSKHGTTHHHHLLLVVEVVEGGRTEEQTILQ
jgi:hypothetical protein